MFNIIINKTIVYMKYKYCSSNNNTFIFNYKQSRYPLLCVVNMTNTAIMTRHLNSINIIIPKLNSMKYTIKLTIHNELKCNVFGILMATEKCLANMLI